MLRLAREVLAPGFATDILVESLCRALAVELPRHFGLLRRGEAGEATPLGEKQLRRIEERTLALGSPMPTVAELAAEFGLSARHFSRVFRKATGMTVAAFIIQQRIAQAKSFLTDRQVSIKEIAFRAGFQNVSAFSAAFRRETGLSPRRFRYAVFENSLRGR
jgi:AraC family transcriptional regulator